MTTTPTPKKITRNRCHLIGRAIAWGCAASYGRQSAMMSTAMAAEAAAAAVRAHYLAGRWTGAQTMRDVVSDAAGERVLAC